VFQIDLVHPPDDISRLRLGTVNFYGIQIELLNIIESKTSFWFIPIMNWSF
jgi:hypothetical protein